MLRLDFYVLNLNNTFNDLDNITIGYDLGIETISMSILDPVLEIPVDLSRYKAIRITVLLQDDGYSVSPITIYSHNSTSCYLGIYGGFYYKCCIQAYFNQNKIMINPLLTNDNTDNPRDIFFTSFRGIK